MAATLLTDKSPKRLSHEATSSSPDLHASSLTRGAQINPIRTSIMGNKTQLAFTGNDTSQPANHCSKAPGNENLQSGLRLTGPSQHSANLVVCTDGSMIHRDASDDTAYTTTEATTDHSVSPYITLSFELPSPIKQLARTQDTEVKLRSKRKQSAAELFPRTDHPDREEYCDESYFWGSEEDERILKESGEDMTSTDTDDAHEAPVFKGCRDPCWR